MEDTPSAIAVALLLTTIFFAGFFASQLSTPQCANPSVMQSTMKITNEFCSIETRTLYANGTTAIAYGRCIA